MLETWKDVVGFEGLYEVSDMGSVRSLRAGKVMRGGKDAKGYHQVSLKVNGTETKRRVHVLVAESFLGVRPEGAHVSHLNGNNQDNRLENLVYETPKENNERKRSHGTLKQGVDVYCSKLTEEQYFKVFELRAALVKQKDIAMTLGLTQSNVSYILTGKLWKHLYSSALEAFPEASLKFRVP